MNLRAFGAVGVMCWACGGSGAAPANDPARESAGGESPGTEASSAAEQAAPTQAPTGEESTSAPESQKAAASAEPPQKSSTAPRDVSYRVTPDGLVVEVDGVELRPRAKAIKSKGGWGVEVTVEATSREARFLTDPDNGPLAFAGKVVRKGEEKPFGDERKGSNVRSIEPGAKETFSRAYPGKGQQPVWWGETLELDVGLWGLGSETERRPLKKFFKLKMVAGNDAKPVISPPIE